MPTHEEIISQFARAKYFSKLDAKQGFWQLQLDEPSSCLCAFNSPHGRHRDLRLLFGMSSVPEVYHKTVHQIFECTDDVTTIADNMVVYGTTKDAHDCSLQEVLRKARTVNLKLNKAKC